MDEVSLRSLFHGALDDVAPPKPWLAAAVREEVRRYRTTTAARRRFRLWTPAVRRAIAAVLVLIVAGTAAAATIAIYERRHQVPVIPAPGGPVTRSCGVDTGIRMFDEKVGWRGTQRTTDGGQTWHDVSPPSLPGEVKGGTATCALDASSAWVVVSTGPGSYQPAAVTVEYTHDAGAEWVKGGTIPVPWATTWRINFSVLLDFADLKHGWLFMEYATNPLKRQVYATADGGTTWTLVSTTPDLGLGQLGYDCAQSGLVFDTLQRGWLTWDCSAGFGDVPGTGTNVIAVTRDGGKTWAQVPLDGLPTGPNLTCRVTSPVFTGDDGIIQVQECGGSHLFSTHDGGTRWTYHELPPFSALDVVDGTTAFYFGLAAQGGPNTLFRTGDGGAKWSMVATGLFPAESVSSLTFINANVGFAAVSDSPAAWWTHDGGKTWALPPPYRSVGSTVCDAFHDPAGGSQLPQSVKMVSPTVGWAPGTRRTTDGGLHWANVAPPAPKDRAQGYGDFFLDADHAWVVDTVGSKTACADHFVVYGTDNGGAGWKQLSSTGVSSLPEDTRVSGGWNTQIQFVDTMHGWIQITSAPGLGTTAGPLYRTSDGGRTWSLLTKAPAWSDGDCRGLGLPHFTSATTGWMQDRCAGALSTANLLVTRDAGLTWSNFVLLKPGCEASDFPNGCNVAPLPTFLDPMNGWWSDNSSLLITRDGGMTWTARSLPHGAKYTCGYLGALGRSGGEVHLAPPPGPQTCQSLSVDAVSFVSPTEGFLAATQYTGAAIPTTSLVEHTTDGGKTWTVVSTRAVTIRQDGGEFFQFVDPNDGFWWFQDVVMKTTDGGRTWTGAPTTYS